MPLQLSNIVFCRTELHYFRGTMPHGIQYHFLGQALVLDIPLQMFVADNVQYHSVAATAGRGMLRHHLARRRRAVSARPNGATEVRRSSLIFKYKTHAE